VKHTPWRKIPDSGKVGNALGRVLLHVRTTTLPHNEDLYVKSAGGIEFAKLGSGFDARAWRWRMPNKGDLSLWDRLNADLAIVSAVADELMSDY
jgi:hypothetical protein